ncbi:VTT domain-containing protein [Haloterrigena sp. SYSU A558-1]|uniref:VTT domain-containing protein n=1 Tax=Haloterrigena gelatinilytica TaxID=2741724 RepID=A0ABX2L813_9EURY|nr:VTT domain-containing protein [Haloterrigena gelatinilytica]NUC71525.1 VTT domain-containing protein [Haloterrigena gelatinilytica]
MVDLTEGALRFVQLYGPFALFLFTFLESSMLFPFLPSEAVVPAAAALLITDPVSFVVFVLAAGAGGTVGAFVPFYVFRGSRVAESDWIRDRITVSDDRIDEGREWFRRWGQSSVLWGRFLPVLRSVISIPAGFADMLPARFGVYTAVGTIAFYAAAGGVVYYGRHRSLFETAFEAATDSPILTVGGTLALLGIGLLVKSRFRRSAFSE